MKKNYHVETSTEFTFADLNNCFCLISLSVNKGISNINSFNDDDKADSYFTLNAIR